MLRRLVIVGLAAGLAAPAFVIAPASAAVLFSCSSVTGSAAVSRGLVHAKRAQSLSSGPTAPAGPADITLASTSDAGVKGSGGGTALGPKLSADGTKVAFASSATNLDPLDVDSHYDIYVKDLSTGDIVLASTSDTGVKGNGDSLALAISADGTRVAFTSQATNLDPVDTDTIADVYVKDLTTGDIVLASTSDTGVKANDGNLFAVLSLSDDGTSVAFESPATNLDPGDTDGTSDVYVKDLPTGDIALASTSQTGAKGNRASYGPTLSADGTVVSLESNATNFDLADTDGLVADVYVKNLNTGEITLASTSDTGVKGDQSSFRSSVSADGTKVAFASVAHNLDPAVTTGYGVYVKALGTGDLVVASTSDTGVNGNGAQGLPSLSGDGTTVAFESEATNLDPADTDALADVYVKDLATGNLTLGSTSDTGVKGNSDNRQPSVSGDGSSVAFTSDSNNLDPADADTVADTYVKQLPATPTSVSIAGCSNGNSGTASIVDIRSYAPRPLGCPTALGGAAGNDYADTTPILVGATLSMTIDWASGPNSYGVAAAKAGPTGTQWRFRLAITASPGHDRPATNQYLPAAGSGFTKTRLQGKLDVSALDSFNCASGKADPLSWVHLANNGSWVAKNS